ncbi:MAG: glycosyltransferase family 4 protein [Opitutaceae bacterium]|nr:glycosyltransferase family 4 protein [Opitutaceae bacterium]
MIIFHTMTAPHVQQAARALHEGGLLRRYVTGLREKPEALSQRIACAGARLCGYDLATQLRRRAVTEVPHELVEDHPWGELLRLCTGRIDRSGRLADLVWERTEAAFDRAVARQLQPNVRGVYGYEYSARHTFERARALGIPTIYETPSPEPRFVQSILDREVGRFPELQSPFYHHTAAREEARIAYRRLEWHAADLVIANSRFTRDSFARAGLDTAKVSVIPLGAPPPVTLDQTRAGGTAGAGPVRFLWAGTFSIRKGAHYLVDAWRLAGLGDAAHLEVFGSQALPAALVQSLPAGITIHAPVPRPILMARYQAADMLVFPTLCDGFGMVATEAWSRGLPVLTTSHAGASDLLRPEVNGLQVPAGDAAALAAALQWCVAHREEIGAMRVAARETAQRWQWADYRLALASTVQSFLAKSTIARARRPAT